MDFFRRRVASKFDFMAAFVDYFFNQHATLVAFGLVRAGLKAFVFASRDFFVAKFSALVLSVLFIERVTL